MPDFIVVNNCAIHDKTEICSSFNDYFINVGPNLTDNLNNDFINDDNFQNISFNECTAFLNPITPKEVIDIVSKF